MICPRCKISERNKHWNAKYCRQCAAQLCKRPMGKLTREQERRVRNLKGTMFIHDLAEVVGTSKPNLTRWARQNGVNIDGNSYPEALVKKVCEYYAKYGKIKAKKRFPGVKIRSIVERYNRQPRQIRWTPDELLELARMGGLVSPSLQAKHFARPNANEGSIKSAWQKKFGHGAINVNGLSHVTAKHFVTHACPMYRTSFWHHRNGPRMVCLWIDVAENLRANVPPHLSKAIKALAKFQLWLHGKNPRRSIAKILEMQS